MARGREPGERIGPYSTFAPATDRRARRIAAGLTQAELAIAANVAERTVRSWERDADCRYDVERHIEDVLNRQQAGHQVAGFGRSTQTGKAARAIAR